MTMIDITNVVNISVIVPPAGLAPYSVNNLVCFTKETPTVALSGSYAVYASPSDVTANFSNTGETYAAALAVFAQSPNILTGGGFFIVIPMLTDEVLEQAITRASTLIYFGGCSATYTLGVTGPTGYTGATGDNLEASRSATVAQSLGKMLFLASDTDADLASPSGFFYTIKSAAQKYVRCLFHKDPLMLSPLKWSYAGRGMSTNFSGSNTTMSMNLKQLSGVTADETISQTLVTAAKAAGVDVYPNIAGNSCTLSHGANEFYDDVYNLKWLIGALEVAGFNHLYQSGTKVPQTEPGMSGLKSAYTSVCGQAVSNGFIAPGEWTGADTFGDPESFRRNIKDYGYYVYSAPIALQSSADRALRKAPLIQIAFKFAGAIHSTSVIVSVNK